MYFFFNFQENKDEYKNKENELKGGKLNNKTAEPEKISSPHKKMEFPKEEEKNNQKDVDPYFDINEWTIERKKR